MATSRAPVRRRIARVAGRLVKWGDRALALLVGSLLDPDTEVRVLALRSIARWPEGVKRLRAVIEESRADAEPEVRVEVESLLR